nr:hypothetical protein [Eggerthella sinensis]
MSALAKRAVRDAFTKLDPREQAKNPVMLMVYLSAILTFILFVLSLFGVTDSHPAFVLAISVVLWLTVLFSNFAEALAEGRGKAQADSLRAAKRDVDAHKLNQGQVAKAAHVDDPAEFFRLNADEVNSATLKKKDLFFVAAGEQIPADGEIVMGAASVDESAITGESAPVIRESGGDRSAVTGGTTVLSDWLVVEVTADAGHSFLDQMIAMVESPRARRRRTRSRSRSCSWRSPSCSSSWPWRCSRSACSRRGRRARRTRRRSPRSSRCSCAWRPPPSARCCRPSALPA